MSKPMEIAKAIQRLKAMEVDYPAGGVVIAHCSVVCECVV